MTALNQLQQAGQSIWLDNIRRKLLTGGELSRYLEDLSVTGLTSNPTIFERAILSSTDYDAAIRKRLGSGQSAESLFFELALEDLTAAAELLTPTYEASGGLDGLVSLEVSPRLAHDTEATINEAKRLYAKAGKANLLIKVPGTEEGLPAIEALIHAGVPVNVTLLFSTEHYLATAEAYIKGLEHRLQDGMDLNVASVASVFISRWDGKTASRLPHELRNQLGIAIAKQTYDAYRKLLASDRWQRLAKAGAQAQRLLWASTGTKDPALSETYYITALAADQTINTIPEPTLLAFAEQGEVKDLLPNNAMDAGRIIAAVEQSGIDLQALATELQLKGRDAFIESYNQLLRCLDTKRKLIERPPRKEIFHLGGLTDRIDTTIGMLAKHKVSQRLWSRDHTLWHEDPTELANRLGWLNSAEEMEGQIETLKTFTEQVKADGLSHVLWCGMGGSSLFPMVLMQAFGHNEQGLDLRVLDTSNPVTMRHMEQALPLDRTLFMFASKSGGTLETRSQFDYFWARINNPDQFAVVTDADSDLDVLASERGFRGVFRNNPDIGGRYSALSHFGMVPAALLGIDIAELLRRTGYIAAATAPCVPAAENPALRLGAILASAAQAGRDKCTLIMPPEISSFGSWLEQLVAESTGKHGVGILPVVDEDLGPPEIYGDDRLFVAYGEHQGLGTLTEAGHPVITLNYTGPLDLGEEVFRWEFATAVAGVVLQITPFDQPNVEAAKKAAGKVLSGDLPQIPTEPLAKILDQVRVGDYIALQAYIDTDSPTLPALQQIRMALRYRYRVATTLGLGPRYLHSTGQFHKGGPATGVFVQVVGDIEPNVPIPGQKYGFSELIQAQAAGDYMALKEAGMRVARVSLDELLAFDG
ncbi:MAG: bifunctional transaldolase/phosoglucose isomerase [Pseudomonadota bacterium]